MLEIFLDKEGPVFLGAIWYFCVCNKVVVGQSHGAMQNQSMSTPLKFQDQSCCFTVSGAH